MRREAGRVDRFCLELANSAADDGKVSMISAFGDYLVRLVQQHFPAFEIRFLIRSQPHRHAWSLREPARGANGERECPQSPATTATGSYRVDDEKFSQFHHAAHHLGTPQADR